MPAKLRLDLSAEQREQLERWTKNPPKAHLRRKAWALLLLAAGHPAYQVAQDRRVQVHRTTVSEWLRRYLSAELGGLKQNPGQGRKPIFSPSGSGKRSSRTRVAAAPIPPPVRTPT